jgi:hypothetical protein
MVWAITILGEDRLMDFKFTNKSIQMQIKNSLFLIFLVLIFGCRKEHSYAPTIYSAYFSDANMLVLGSPSGATGDDSVKLYKLTTADKFETITYISTDGVELVDNDFTTTGIYDLDSSHFLLNVYLKSDNSKAIQSYVMSKSSGVACKLSEAIIPKIYQNNEWKFNYIVPAFSYLNKNTTYISNGEKLYKLNIQNESTVNLSSYNLNEGKSEIDNDGNILCGSELYFTNNTEATVTEMTSNTLVAKRFNSGFYIANVYSDSISISKLNISDNSYSFSWLDSIKTSTTNWEYLGSAPVRNLNGSCLVFNKGIIYLDETGATSLSFSKMSLASINSYYYSDIAIYITGYNTLQREVFMKIVPDKTPVSFSHIMGPGYYNYHIIQANAGGSMSFYATFNDNSVLQFCYVSTTTSQIVDNEFGVTVKQLLTIK